MLYRKSLDYIFIVLISIVLFFPFLGAVHLFDWDEINFAESAREMLLTKDFLSVQIDFHTFWEKPPFFIWMQALSMKIFGVNEFAARFPNAINGIFTALILFEIGKKHFSRKFGLIWVFVYFGAILPHFYFKSGIIDPWFNFFIFLGHYFIVCYFQNDENRFRNATLSGFFIGMGVLTKGPVALLIFAISVFVYFIIKRFKNLKIRVKDVVIFTSTLTFAGGFWFILQILDGNYSIIVDFIVYQIRLFKTQDAGHGGFPLYHFVILFFGVFPASIFAIKGFKNTFEKDSFEHSFHKWMFILFWVVLIMFSIVKTKIVHYSSLCYYPLTFFAAKIGYDFYNKKIKWNRWISVSIIIVASLLSVSVSGMYFVGKYSQIIAESGLIKDVFARANLMAQANWIGFEFILGLLLIIPIVFAFIKYKKDYWKRFVLITATTLIFINLTLTFVVPRVEAYSQRAAIEFFEERINEDCYVDTYHKSYAHLFYSKKQPQENKNSYNLDWLLTGDIDKPVYIVVKINRQMDFEEKYPNFVKMGDKNGFCFFKRDNN